MYDVSYYIESESNYLFYNNYLFCNIYTQMDIQLIHFNYKTLR